MTIRVPHTKEVAITTEKMIKFDQNAQLITIQRDNRTTTTTVQIVEMKKGIIKETANLMIGDKPMTEIVERLQRITETVGFQTTGIKGTSTLEIEEMTEGWTIEQLTETEISIFHSQKSSKMERISEAAGHLGTLLVAMLEKTRVPKLMIVILPMKEKEELHNRKIWVG